jgi:DNA-binding HxlR family transcriptional regulator
VQVRVIASQHVAEAVAFPKTKSVKPDVNACAPEAAQSGAVLAARNRVANEPLRTESEGLGGSGERIPRPASSFFESSLRLAPIRSTRRVPMFVSAQPHRCRSHQMNPAPKNNRVSRNGDSAVQEALNRVGDRWTIHVVRGLRERPMRFNQLKPKITEISSRMLAMTLRKLERDGIVSRTTSASSASYQLTPLGVSFLGPVGALVLWVDHHKADVDAAREAYDNCHACHEPGGAGNLRSTAD